MADFQEQVMALTGLTIDGSSTAPSRSEFSTFLNDGVIDVTNKTLLLRPQDIDNFLREGAEQTSNGFNPGTNQIVAVLRESGTNNEWYPCRKESISLQYRVTDTNSLYYASKYNPVYMITQNRNVHVYPAPSSAGNDTFKVLYVNSSPEETDGTALDHASTGIKWFPDDKIYLVVLYASIQSLMSKITSLNNSLPSDITLPAVPIQPTMNATTVSIPSFTTPDAFIQPVAPAGADVDFSSVPTAPVYVSSLLTLGATPTISDLTISAISPVSPSGPSFTAPDISSIFNPASSPPSYTAPVISLGTAPTISDLSISAVSPATPSLTSVTFTSIDSALDASTPVFSTATISASSTYTGSAPAYTKPVLSLRGAPTISDLTISAVAPVAPSLTDTTVTESSITEPSFIPPVMSVPDFSDTNTWISTEEDSEMLAARVQEIQAKIGEYSARMGEAQAQFNKDNAIFQKDIQIAIQNAQIESAEDGMKLQKFSNEVQQYQANVAKEVQEYQQNLAGDLQVWQAERQTDLQKYNTDVQNEVNEFNKENVAYQSAIQESIQELQVANGVNLAKAQADLQLAKTNKDRDQQRQLQNGINDLQAIVQDNTRKITLYQAEVGTYQAVVNKEVQEYQQNLAGDIQVWQAERATDLQKHGSDIQNALNTFNKDNVEYQAQLQQATQEVGLVLQKENQEYAAELQKYNAEVQNYQANVAKEVQEYQQNLAGDIQVWQTERQTDLQKYGSDIQSETSRVTNDMKIYQAELAKATQQYQVETGYDMSKYQAEIQAATAKFTNDLGKNNATFQADLGKFTADLKETQQENQEKIALYTAEIQEYNAELTGKVQEFTASLQKDQADYQWATAQYAALKAQYNEAFSVMAPSAQKQPQQQVAQRRR